MPVVAVAQPDPSPERRARPGRSPEYDPGKWSRERVTTSLPDRVTAFLFESGRLNPDRALDHIGALLRPCNRHQNQQRQQQKSSWHTHGHQKATPTLTHRVDPSRPKLACAKSK